MKILTLLRSKIKALFASKNTDEKLSNWNADFKEKEAYKQERAKWRALQQITMLF